jgi:energy-coupling factor transporter ATP-binding protein EcfA2
MSLELKSIEFKNFKVLRDATLPLGTFNLLVGPNGSGKSTALAALQMMTSAVTNQGFPFRPQVESCGVSSQGVSVAFSVQRPPKPCDLVTLQWESDHHARASPLDAELFAFFRAIRTYSLEADEISAPVELDPNAELMPSGRNLATVLDQIGNAEPERFESLNEEIGSLLPEYDRILLPHRQKVNGHFCCGLGWGATGFRPKISRMERSLPLPF